MCFIDCNDSFKRLAVNGPRVFYRRIRVQQQGKQPPLPLFTFDGRTGRLMS